MKQTNLFVTVLEAGKFKVRDLVFVLLVSAFLLVETSCSLEWCRASHGERSASKRQPNWCL
jgi:hypothetical protein